MKRHSARLNCCCIILLFSKKIRLNIKNQAVNLQTKLLMMSQRSIYFLVVLVLICYGEIFSQKKSFVYPEFDSIIVIQSKEKKINPVSDIIGPSFYSRHLGFFCRKELLFEKKIAIPLRLRLGSLDYTNYLEQKLNTRRFVH